MDNCRKDRLRNIRSTGNRKAPSLFFCSGTSASLIFLAKRPFLKMLLKCGTKFKVRKRILTGHLNIGTIEFIDHSLCRYKLSVFVWTSYNMPSATSNCSLLFQIRFISNSNLEHGAVALWFVSPFLKAILWDNLYLFIFLSIRGSCRN